MTKQQILEEIKRTATDNGGIPLGREKFSKETAIRFSDWYGKYWVNWSEAVLEAGFSPNQMQKAYDINYLLEKFVILTRELKRIPVAGDLRMKARNDSSFPSHSVFGRLGKKTQLLSRAKEYCLTHEGFEDVLPLFDAVLDSATTSEERGSDKFTDGFVYLIRMRKTRFYKLGRSNNLSRRIQEIKLPEEPDIVHYIKTDDPAGIEAYWHKRFEDRRKNGEWFELTASDIKAFKRRKFM